MRGWPGLVEAHGEGRLGREGTSRVPVGGHWGESSDESSIERSEE